MENTNIDRNKLRDLRASLSSESLKTVDIRVDFSGVPDIALWANAFINTDLGSIFGDYKIAASHAEEYDENSLNALSYLVDIPVKMILKMPVHIFSEGQYRDLEDSLTLRLSNVSAQLTINCQNYQSIDPYLIWMTKLVEALKTAYRTFRLRRFGIRKLDGFMSYDIREVESWLETDCFYTPGAPEIPTYNSKYEDKYLLSDSDITAGISCARLFRVGTSEGQQAYQALVDLQANVSADLYPSLLQDGEAELLKIGMSLNDMLFFSFLKYITAAYIASHKK